MSTKRERKRNDVSEIEMGKKAKKKNPTFLHQTLSPKVQTEYNP